MDANFKWKIEKMCLMIKELMGLYIRIGTGQANHNKVDIGISADKFVPDIEYDIYGLGPFVYASQCYSIIELSCDRRSIYAKFVSPFDVEFDVYFNREPPKKSGVVYLAIYEGKLIINKCTYERNGEVIVIKS